eukprot:CAMPEP_0118988774 /NCGR_PEP_ID=MMETSP1173-20130426/46824_1 /TAXON_ID=1034831 /ORGANISM="Rhizochromulina marina cf, Strain CCMP1243" /LENGTH=164 /DNA_ID=CAMNT_0006939725 /DNA_START=759 /DNA_END=1250 /DNA_ORIENTATION=+
MVSAPQRGPRHGDEERETICDSQKTPSLPWVIAFVLVILVQSKLAHEVGKGQKVIQNEQGHVGAVLAVARRCKYALRRLFHEPLLHLAHELTDHTAQPRRSARNLTPFADHPMQPKVGREVRGTLNEVISRREFKTVRSTIDMHLECCSTHHTPRGWQEPEHPR